ncbi:glycosyltransferase family 4 protein [Tepidibacter hydrothermalis]|uniref:Glycosyltransferase family 4 protein n=1 Tax=Tepidibacter hydrothermalis TaxID=3036126 RepID=A0ABY8EHD2_9FIRM|nr:glycosyltransferase family 4 protein [Tepidibacter hydrothermalis]WFD10245.1 glycosyltransferase family 4 protein [Tepidibacter hydrothermalis]
MKILHITAQKPFKTGSGIYVRKVIEQFDKKGFKQAIIAGISNEEKIDIDTHLSLEKYPVYFNVKEMPFPVIGMSDVMPYESTRYRDLDENMIDCFRQGFSRQVIEAVEIFNPDIIICHHLYFLTALTRSLIKDKKIFGVCHGTDLRQLKSIDLKQDFIKDNIRKLDAILALHNDQKEDIKEYFDIKESNIHVVGSGYDDSIFYSRDSSYEKDCIKVIYAGKISYSKGLIPLIKAFSSLDIPKDKIKLSLAGMGSGKEYKDILNTAKESPYKIEFLGNLIQDDLAEKFRQSDIFILPSFYEGLPLVLIEALASGLYVITSEIPGVRQWLGEEINNSGKIRYLTLPRLINVDIPVEEDLPMFENNIKNEIQKIIKNINENKYNNNLDVTHLSWRKLSNRIEKILYKF